MASSILPNLERHPHWSNLVHVVQTLEGAGFKAVLAGGSVRDALLNRPVHDFDIASSARPEDIERIFPRTLAVGRAFGVMVVIEGGKSFEVATFRRDGPYRDGRHPEEIEFSSLEEDAKRRDFTVNAMFYRVASDEIIDLVGGLHDLKLKVVRAVGEARARMTEDRLRVLRAVRFAAQLGFVIEAETWNATKELAGGLESVAKERQIEELRKLALSPRAPYGWELLRQSGILKYILPNLNRAVEEYPSSWQSALLGLGQNGRILELAATLAWFALVFHLPSEQPVRWIQDLKGSSREVQMARGLVEDLNQLCSGDLRLGKRLQLLDSEWGMLLIHLWPSVARQIGALDVPAINTTVERFRDLMNAKGHLPPPIVNGHDLEQLGLKPGPQFGRLLDKAYVWQLEGEKEKSRLIEDLKREINFEY